MVERQKQCGGAERADGDLCALTSSSTARASRSPVSTADSRTLSNRLSALATR